MVLNPLLNLNGYASCHVESNCITWFLLISNGLYIYVQICKLKRACIFFFISANFSPQCGMILGKVAMLILYRVSQKYPDDFLKMGVASKLYKPRLQNFLCFLSIIMANFSESLVTIASIFPLSMALLG